MEKRKKACSELIWLEMRTNVSNKTDNSKVIGV